MSAKFEEQVMSKFDQIDQRFEQMDRRFDKIDERFDKMDERLDKMNEKLDSMNREIKDFRESVKAEFGAIEFEMQENSDNIRKDIKKVDDRVSKAKSIVHDVSNAVW